MMYPQGKWICVALLSSLLLVADAQQRPRTRLEIMIDDFMDDMSSFATRINTAFFAEAPQRFRRPAPRPQLPLAGSIDNFQAVPEVLHNDISFDSTNQVEDDQFAANSPHRFSGQNEFVSQPLVDTNAQGSQDIKQQQSPNPAQQFRPRIPPRSSGFGIRQFVNRAMDRVRNMLPATRRRFTADPGFRVNNQQQQGFQQKHSRREAGDDHDLTSSLNNQ